MSATSVTSRLRVRCGFSTFFQLVAFVVMMQARSAVSGFRLPYSKVGGRSGGAGFALPRHGGAARLRPRPSSLLQTRWLASVSGTAYEAAEEEKDGAAAPPVVTLFTKEGCTLCDRVQDVLRALRATHPHTLRLQDITDDGGANPWFDRYKYDIPVLHLNGAYWAKHRLAAEEAAAGLAAARRGAFASPPGEPNAAALERQRAEREG